MPTSLICLELLFKEIFISGAAQSYLNDLKCSHFCYSCLGLNLKIQLFMAESKFVLLLFFLLLLFLKLFKILKK